MSDDDKHRARIFLHRGQLAQAKTAYEQAVSDDRLANDPAPSPTHLAIWVTSARSLVIWIRLKPAIEKSSRSNA